MALLFVFESHNGFCERMKTFSFAFFLAVLRFSFFVITKTNLFRKTQRQAAVSGH